MTKMITLLICLLASSLSFAKVKFNCYDNPNIPVMAYQAGSLNCAKEQAQNLASTANVFCVYTAVLCEAVADGEKPTQLTPEQVFNYTNNFQAMAESSFKFASISCKGAGELDGNKMLHGNCPSINACADDIAFNGTPAMINGKFGLSREPGGSVTVDSPNIQKDGMQ
jgi:hypothetical protein